MTTVWTTTWIAFWASSVLVLDQPQYVANWVAALGGEVAPTVDTAIGVEYEGDLYGGVYFDSMTANNIFAHIAFVGGILPPGLLMSVGDYVYKQLKLDRMTFAVPANNRRTVAFVEKMGAQLEASLSRACGDCDLLLYALWRTDPYAQKILARTETHYGI